MKLTIIPANDDIAAHYYFYDADNVIDASEINLVFPEDIRMWRGQTRIIDMQIRTEQDSSYMITPITDLARTPFSQPNAPMIVHKDYNGRIKVAINFSGQRAWFYYLLLCVMSTLSTVAAFTGISLLGQAMMIAANIATICTITTRIKKGTKLLKIVSRDLSDITYSMGVPDNYSKHKAD